MPPQAHHVGVTVSDLDRALTLYHDRLGLPIADQFSLDTKPFNRLVNTTGRSANIAFLDAGNCSIELLEFDEQTVNRNEGAVGTDIGVSHVSLEVDDVDARYEELSDDYEFLCEPQKLSVGPTVATMYDPDGNFVELLEEE